MDASILMFLPIVALVFLVFREVVTWYWKLNKISNLLEKIEENTRPKTSALTKEEETPPTP